MSDRMIEQEPRWSARWISEIPRWREPADGTCADTSGETIPSWAWIPEYRDADAWVALDARDTGDPCDDQPEIGDYLARRMAARQFAAKVTMGVVRRRGLCPAYSPGAMRSLLPSGPHAEYELTEDGLQKQHPLYHHHLTIVRAAPKKVATIRTGGWLGMPIPCQGWGDLSGATFDVGTRSWHGVGSRPWWGEHRPAYVMYGITMTEEETFGLRVPDPDLIDDLYRECAGDVRMDG